jgi:parallel beta-helix repeat protein
MRKSPLMRKGLVVGIILLFVGTGIIPLAAQEMKKTSFPTSRENWLYVGGNGPGNYSRIQDAIDNASDGDTIFVYEYSSPYSEHVIIPRSITLTGENKTTTIIDGNGNGTVVLLNKSSSFVTIQGFTITHGFYGVIIESNNNTVFRNTISNNEYGVYLNYPRSNHNTIAENIIASNYREGIEVNQDSHNNTILRNTIASNINSGITLYYGCLNNNIKNNTIQNNSVGIRLYEICMFNTIIGNILSHNRNDSIILHISHNNTIEGNNIENVTFYQSYGNSIRRNNFIGHVQHVRCFSGRNTWDANYWDNWIGLKWNGPVVQKLPKIIVCWILPFWIMGFDWHPAKEPYDIGG